MLRTRILLILALSILLAGSGARTQEPDPEPGTTFRGEQRVTAVDLVVAFEADRKLPRRLRPRDFTVLYDGRERPVIAVEAPGRPWEIVLYFDLGLANSAAVRWAASALAEWVPELAALGRVEIVLADPTPRTVLAPSHDAEIIHGVLSQLALFPEGDDELVELRSAFMDEIRSGEPVLPPDALVPHFVAEEVRIVRRSQDQLLTRLVEPGEEGVCRALFLVSGGFDLDPAEFYRPYLAATAGPPASLKAVTEELTRTLAAYGWITFALVPPPVDSGLKKGVRIGKWRFPVFFPPFVVGVYEEDRNPERAEAYLELGTALRQQGKLADAEEALRKAVHHFYGDPKTASRQAVALVELGKLLDERGAEDEARRAFAQARLLDPSATEAEIGLGGVLLDPVAPLRRMARVTVGELVQDAETLATVIAGLERRVRVTYQVPGPPQGRLHSVQMRFRRQRYPTEYPAWARSSTPETVTAARLRRLLDGGLEKGLLDVALRFHPTAPGPGKVAGERRGEVEIGIDLPLAAEQETVVRVTLGFAGPESAPIVRSEASDRLPPADPGPWRYRTDVTLDEDQIWVAVLVEDLNTGTWGAEMIELDEPEPSGP